MNFPRSSIIPTFHHTLSVLCGMIFGMIAIIASWYRGQRKQLVPWFGFE